ncbi:MAG: FHA domain-containing protein [Planctomycetes bacterium]|nr:FHA domain-containing protein [Planctomycetota bacterium]
MSTGIPFQAFLLRHQYTPERAFLDEFPLGCLLDSANPTRSSQRGASIHPLCKRDGAPAVTGPSIAIAAQAAEDAADLAHRSRIVVGADRARADVQIKGEGVAPVHAYFVLRRGRLHLADCGAPGGTFIAGQRLTPGQRVPLRSDAITEVWFGEEGFFHFDARSLFSYIHYLLGTRDARPRLEADTCARAAAPEPAPAPAAASEPPPAAAPDPWASGLRALRQLGPDLQAVRVRMERAPAPVTLFDAAARQDLEQALRALEGLRHVVTGVHARLRRSRFELTVFQR